MLELAADLRLLDEPADHLGLVAVLLPQDLDGQVAAQVGIVPLEDHAHAAAAQHPKSCNRSGRSRSAGPGSRADEGDAPAPGPVRSNS